jgi:lysophospholipase L1-like esterase
MHIKHRSIARPSVFYARCLIILVCLIAMLASAQTNDSVQTVAAIRYAVIGDSYSCGEGASLAESWPALLTRHLSTNGLAVSLVSNPAKTGWTSQQALDDELPVWKAAKPDFATLQIGVNDWVQGVDAGTFRQHLILLMDAMLKALPDTNRLLVVNIPDFSVTPTGAMYGDGRNISDGLAGFNKIIKEEASKRNLKVVDVFPLSQKMHDDHSLIARDGLHPSAREYALWETVVYPVAHELLSKPAR